MKNTPTEQGMCPFRGTRIGGALQDAPDIDDLYPDRLRVGLLQQHSETSDPMDPDFGFAEAFKTPDLDAVQTDILAMLRTRQPWWPVAYGHCGPQMIRMA